MAGEAASRQSVEGGSGNGARPAVADARNGTAQAVRSLLPAIVLVAGFAELAYVIVNISAMPVYIHALDLDVRWIGAIGTVYLVVEGLLKSPFGVLGDRVGRKALIMGGPAISMCTAAITPYTHDPYALCGLRVLDGMGAAALWPSCFSLIGDFVPEQRRGHAMSMFNLAYILGIALGPAIGGNINDWAHHDLHFSLAASKGFSFYVAAILFAMTVLVAMIYVPGARPAHHAADASGMEGSVSFRQFFAMLGRMPATLAMAFVTFFGIGLIMLYVKVFAMDRYGPFHLSERLFGDYLIIPALLIASVSVPLGAISDRIGKANAVKIGIGVCALSFWLLILFPSVPALIGFGTLVGVGFVMAFPAWMALVSADCASKNRGAVVGSVGTAQGFGAILGAALSAFLYKQPAFRLGMFTIPPHGLPFLGCSILLTISFILALTTVRDRMANAAAGCEAAA